MALSVEKIAQIILVGNLLDEDTDWKALLQAEGEKVVREALREKWERRLRPRYTEITQRMQNEGWSWANAQDAGFLARQKVQTRTGDPASPAFLLSRDALFDVWRHTGAPGGRVRDGLRDAYDNAVFAAAEKLFAVPFDKDTPLSTIVALTGQALVDVVL